METVLHPHKALIKRIEALKDYVSPLQIMIDAKVTYANYHNWQKTDSEMIVRWFRLMKELKLDPLKAKPGVNTYIVVKKLLLTRDAVCALFVKAGYSNQIADIWAERGDPRPIENFKKVNEVVSLYELELQKA